MSSLVSTIDILNCIKPTCFRCGKDVDSLEYETDFRTLQVYIGARCHGEFEIMALEKDFFQENLGHGLGKGVAFKPKPELTQTMQLPEPPK